jgi:hypothetical protein
MIATYIFSSAAFFTVWALASIMPPRKEYDAICAAISTAFAVLGWIAAARWF